MYGYASYGAATGSFGNKERGCQDHQECWGDYFPSFGSVVRSLLVAIYELGVNEVMIVGHTDCGAKHMDSEQMIEVMKKRGIPSEHIDMMRYCGIDFKSWLRGFDTPEGSVRETVTQVQKHPLIPKDITVRGFVIDSTTGELATVV